MSRKYIINIVINLCKYACILFFISHSYRDTNSYLHSLYMTQTHTYTHYT